MGPAQSPGGGSGLKPLETLIISFLKQPKILDFVVPVMIWKYIFNSEHKRIQSPVKHKIELFAEKKLLAESRELTL